MSTQQTDRRTAILATVSAVVGLVVVVVLFVLQADPDPLWLWATFTVAFVGLEFSSVEVNDRLFISSSIMVAFAAAVVFGRSTALLSVALMAAITVVHPRDLGARRWRQPAYNFGQLVVSVTIGALVLFPFLPAGGLVAGDLPRLVVGAALASTVYDWINFRLVTLFVRTAYPGRELRSWSHLLMSHVALAVLGAYGALLGAAYRMVGPVALPLMLGTFLVGHVGFASYSRLRQAHEDTIAGFVKAIEALDPYTKGHTERVAEFCRITGERLGLDGRQMEVLRWAALIHDVGKLAAPPELISKEGTLTPSEREHLERRMRVVEELLSRVEFLAPAVAAMSSTVEDGSVISRVLQAADAFDGLTSTRSYRRAVTQGEAFERLRARTAEFGADVVEALTEAILDGGVAYGLPETVDVEEVERLVRERARRA